ncbi:MAG: tetratricopeptide repeat protein [Planctomycetota bacterium]|nr:tetratricopeptide repeat protein [Planctomycetota bacterium]
MTEAANTALPKRKRMRKWMLLAGVVVTVFAPVVVLFATGTLHLHFRIGRLSSQGFLRMGEREYAKGGYQEAENCFRGALDRAIELDSDEDCIAAFLALASAHEAQGEDVEAEANLRAALVTSEQTKGEDRLNTADVIGRLAWMMARKRNYAEARALYRRALDMCREALPPGDMRLVATTSNLGMVASLEGDHTTAQGLFEEAISMADKAGRSEDPGLINVWDNRATSYSKQGRWTEAEQCLARAIGIAESNLGTHALDLVPLLEEYAHVLDVQGRKGEASRANLRARGILARHRDESGRPSPETP